MSTRRDFIKKASLGGATLLFSNIAFGTKARKIVGANDRIRVGVIGVNGHGMTHVNAYRKMEGVEIAAICDIDTAVLNRVVSGLKSNGVNTEAFSDMRRMLDRPEIDAVSIATPNHWHALATVWACQAGKHVCVEKPASHTIWEGRKMVEAARKYNCMVQADLDYRSNINIARAFDYMHQQLGAIKLVRIMNYKRRTSIGRIIGPGTIPTSIDYDQWVGPSPMKALPRKRLHYDWHWQWATGNSELGNNGPHQLDITRWGLNKQTLPTSVFSFGGRYGYVDDGETPNTQVAVYDYDGIPVIYDSRGLGERTGVENMDGTVIYTATGTRIFNPYKGDANCVYYFVCEHGVLFGNTVYDNDGKVVKSFREPGSVGPQFNFINALRSNKRDDLRVDILQGHLSACISHMGNISYQMGQSTSVAKVEQMVATDPNVKQVYFEMKRHLLANSVNIQAEEIIMGPTLCFDSAKEQFVGEHGSRANLFTKGSYRDPYTIPGKV